MKVGYVETYAVEEEHKHIVSRLPSKITCNNTHKIMIHILTLLHTLTSFKSGGIAVQEIQ